MRSIGFRLVAMFEIFADDVANAAVIESWSDAEVRAFASSENGARYYAQWRTIREQLKSSSLAEHRYAATLVDDVLARLDGRRPGRSFEERTQLDALLAAERGGR